MPKVIDISVVMSVFNGEEYLAEAIESILDQTFSNFEFIIINDGSTDGSLEIINSYLKKDNRIVLLNRENKGLAASLNDGIVVANGKYIARMDSDDISLPKRLQTQYEFMEANKKIGICGTNAYKIDEKNQILKTLCFRKKIYLPRDDCQLKATLIFSSCFVHSTVFIRRKIFSELNEFYDPALRSAQDFDLWVRLSKNIRFQNLPQCLLLYRVTKNGITQSGDRVLKANTVRKLLKFYLKDFDGFDLDLHMFFSAFDLKSLGEYEPDALISYFLLIEKYSISKYRSNMPLSFYYRVYKILTGKGWAFLLRYSISLVGFYFSYKGR